MKRVNLNPNPRQRLSIKQRRLGDQLTESTVTLGAPPMPNILNIEPIKEAEKNRKRNLSKKQRIAKAKARLGNSFVDFKSKINLIMYS